MPVWTLTCGLQWCSWSGSLALFVKGTCHPAMTSLVHVQLENVAIAKALQLEAARRRAVPIRFHFVARVKFELAQPTRCRLTAYLLLIRYAVTLNFDPVTLTFDLWPWTCVVDRLRHGRTLYEIWAKSNNPRRSYCDLNIWPCDLEHISRAPLCCGIVCTNFKLSQAIR